MKMWVLTSTGQISVWMYNNQQNQDNLTVTDCEYYEMSELVVSILDPCIFVNTKTTPLTHNVFHLPSISIDTYIYLPIAPSYTTLYLYSQLINIIKQ